MAFLNGAVQEPINAPRAGTESDERDRGRKNNKIELVAVHKPFAELYLQDDDNELYGNYDCDDLGKEADKDKDAAAKLKSRENGGPKTSRTEPEWLEPLGGFTDIFELRKTVRDKDDGKRNPKRRDANTAPNE
jgi:hypothetical protein